MRKLLNAEAQRTKNKMSTRTLHYKQFTSVSCSSSSVVNKPKITCYSKKVSIFILDELFL